MSRPFADAPTIAVALPSWVGDVAMAEPAIRALRQAAAGSRLVALARPGLGALLAGRALLDECIEHPMRGALGPVSAARLLRRLRPGAILLLPNSVRAALGPFLARVPRRVGYATEGRGILLTDRVAPPSRSEPSPTTDWYADLLERGAGIEVRDRVPRLAPDAGQRRTAATLLAEVPRPFAVLVPGANRADKRWPAERFALLGRELRRRGLAVAVSGGPAERSLVGEVAAAAGGVDLAARGGGLGALLGVLEEAALLVTNDTGPRHLAIGVGTPVVCLYGPTDWRWTAIRGVPERRILAEPFLPESTIADRHARACGMERIAVGDVLAACEELLAHARPRTG